MIRYLLFTCCLAGALPVFCQSRLTVKVEKLSGKTGSIYLAVYNTAATYMQPDKCFLQKIHAVNKQEDVLIALGEVPKGQYAVVLFLDENSNGQLDKNFLGIPKEKYGFSGTRQPLFRAPAFEEAVMRLDTDSSTAVISLH